MLEGVKNGGELIREESGLLAQYHPQEPAKIPSSTTMPVATIYGGKCF
jgi:hypothetical protein